MGKIVTHLDMSPAEFVRKCLSGDAVAEREYLGVVSGDAAGAAPKWAVKLSPDIADLRPVSDRFGRRPIPAKGLHLSYGQVTAATLAGAVQEEGGSPLPTIDVNDLVIAEAGVATIGAGAILPQRMIDRLDDYTLDEVLAGLVAGVAVAAEARVVDAVLDAIADEDAPLTAVELTAFTAAGLEAGVRELRAQMRARGLVLSGLLASPATLSALYAVEAATSVLGQPTGRDLFGVELVELPGAPVGDLVGFSRRAFVVLESPTVRLWKHAPELNADVSMHMFQSIVRPRPDALIRLAVA